MSDPHQHGHTWHWHEDPPEAGELSVDPTAAELARRVHAIEHALGLYPPARAHGYEAVDVLEQAGDGRWHRLPSANPMDYRNPDLVFVTEAQPVE